MELSKDLLEFIQLLNQNKVQYLIVGGWAVGLHGKPRYTKDVDILIRREEKNAEKIITTIEEFGFSKLDISKSDFLTPSFIIQLGVEPNRIDLITDIVSVDFEEAYKNRIEIEHEEISLSLISIEDLIANKLSSARPQDLVDVETLRKMQEKKNR